MDYFAANQFAPDAELMRAALQKFEVDEEGMGAHLPPVLSSIFGEVKDAEESGGKGKGKGGAKKGKKAAASANEDEDESFDFFASLEAASTMAKSHVEKMAELEAARLDAAQASLQSRRDAAGVEAPTAEDGEEGLSVTSRNDLNVLSAFEDKNFVKRIDRIVAVTGKLVSEIEATRYTFNLMSDRLVQRIDEELPHCDGRKFASLPSRRKRPLLSATDEEYIDSVVARSEALSLDNGDVGGLRTASSSQFTGPEGGDYCQYDVCVAPEPPLLEEPRSELYSDDSFSPTQADNLLKAAGEMGDISSPACQTYSIGKLRLVIPEKWAKMSPHDMSEWFVSREICRRKRLVESARSETSFIIRWPERLQLQSKLVIEAEKRPAIASQEVAQESEGKI